MKKITLLIDENLLTQMGLSNAADDAAVATALKSLVAKANKVDDLQNKLTTAETGKKTAEDDLAAFQANVKKEKVTALLSNAVTAGKITQEASNQFSTDYAENPEGLEKVLNSLKAYVPATTLLDNNSNGEIPADLKDKNWNDLFAIRGKLEEVKAKYPDHFKKLYRDQFNKDYAG